MTVFFIGLFFGQIKGSYRRLASPEGVILLKSTGIT
jgi:hypothetical protein